MIAVAGGSRQLGTRLVAALIAQGDPACEIGLTYLLRAA